MNGQKCCFTNFKTGSGFCLLFILKMSLFGYVIFKDLFTKELKSLLNHFFGWIKNTFHFFNKLQNILLKNLGIFATLNHGDKIASIKVSLGSLVISGNKFERLLNKRSEIGIGLSSFVGDLLDDLLEDKVVMRVDIEAFGVDIDCLDEGFLVFELL